MSRVTNLQLPVLGGALCLDFVNTVDPRHKEPREEFLGSYAELVRWAEFIGAVEPEDAAQLARAGEADPPAAEAVHARAIELREALYRLFTPRPRAQTPEASLATLESEWHGAMTHARLEPAGGAFLLDWEDPGALDRVLWPVARSAVTLMTSTALTRVGECRADACGWLFLDTSKAQRRRWCSMAICGNREKARRHRERARG